MIKDIYRQIGIYGIMNLVSGMTYIGMTSMNFGDRWDSHRALLRYGNHSNAALQADWNFYGEENFEFYVVECVDSDENLGALERKYIAAWRSMGLCYNVYDGGIDGAKGRHLSEETKRKIGEKNREHMTGRKASEETRQKMSAAHKAMWAQMPDEERARRGAMSSQINSGRVWSDEAKQRFADIQKTHPNGAKLTADQVLEMRAKFDAGVTRKELALEYGVSYMCVRNVVARTRWANI